MINYIHDYLNLPPPAGVTAVFVRVYYCFGINRYTPKVPPSLVLLKTDRVSCLCYNPDFTTNAEHRLDSRPFKYPE